MERETKALEPSELSKKLAEDRERELNQKLHKAKQALLGMQTVKPKEPVREEVPRFRGGRYSKPIETALKALGEEQAAEGMRSRKYEETTAEMETQEKITEPGERPPVETLCPLRAGTIPFQHLGKVICYPGVTSFTQTSKHPQDSRLSLARCGDLCPLTRSYKGEDCCAHGSEEIR